MTVKQTRLELETLEARDVPAIVFASYGDGTWAYNADNGNWRHLTQHQPMAMDEGQDGVLYASYGDGTYRYNYDTNHWYKLTSSTTTVLSAPDVGNCLFASFDSGTFRWKGSAWLKTADAEARLLAAVDDKEYYGAFGDGTYRWDANQGHQLWTKITSAYAYAMDASSGGALFASYGNGTFEFENGWQHMTSQVASTIEAVSDNLVYFAAAGGTYAGGAGGAAGLLSYTRASALAYDADLGLIGSFYGWSGTWVYDGNEANGWLDWDLFENSTAGKMAH